MSPLLRPACIDDPGELAELVSEAIGEIIGGGVLLDTALGNDEFGYFDLVAANGDGEAVFFFINFSGGETEYLRLLKCMRWYQENRHALQKLYAGRVALGPAPPVFLVAPRYSDSMRKVLLNICESRIVLLKYVCFQDGEDKRSLFIEKVGDSLEESGKTDPMCVPDVRAEASPSELIADRSKIEPKERVIDPREFRRETGTDISNVSDEELLDLLE
ncbi:MAG: hypothetical protein WAN11_19805 [Syntrophobacteraceae bacterium]